MPMKPLTPRLNPMTEAALSYAMTEPSRHVSGHRAVSLVTSEGEFWSEHLADPDCRDSWLLYHRLAAEHLCISEMFIEFVEAPSSPPDPVRILVRMIEGATPAREVVLTSLSQVIWRGAMREIEADGGLLTCRSMCYLRDFASRHFRVLAQNIHLMQDEQGPSEPIIVTACADLRPLRLRAAVFREWRDLALPIPDWDPIYSSDSSSSSDCPL